MPCLDSHQVLSEIRDYPQTLATMGAIKKTSLVFVNRMQGLLYDIRADINLYSQLLDPPDLLWNDPSLVPPLLRLPLAFNLFHLSIQSFCLGTTIQPPGAAPEDPVAHREAEPTP
jgi:hypothetical protein